MITAGVVQEEQRGQDGWNGVIEGQSTVGEVLECGHDYVLIGQYETLAFTQHPTVVI